MSATTERGVLAREIKFLPAFDKRHTDPSRNYGIHGVDMRMYVKGERGAVQFVLYTDWHLPHVAEELNARGSRLSPTPADLGYHSPIPTYDGQENYARDDCDVIGCRCYYDGSSLNADRIFNVLLSEGSDAVWRELEAYYDEALPSLDEIAAYRVVADPQP